MAIDLVIRSRRVVLPEGVRAASVHLAGERISAIERYDDIPIDVPHLDAEDAVIMPGVVDSHVHINEPGRTSWEGFKSASRAAAAGGVTTLVDMPLNSIPATTSVAALRDKRQAATGQLFVDLALWGGVVPGNAAELVPMLKAGACGFKCFLIDSGVSEFAAVKAADLHAALPILSDAGAPLLVHAELAGPVDDARQMLAGADFRRYASFLASRPRAAENQAVALMASLARQHKAPVHIVHLSSCEALPLIEAARHDGALLSAETCPHYLHFTAEAVPDGRTDYKCVPPIREAENRDKLWDGLRRGVLDQIVSDHSPCEPQKKLLAEGDFDRAWGGIASLQLGLSVTWSEMRRRDTDLTRLAEWMCDKPARLAGLGGRKGRLEVGYDADIVIWEPATAVEVEASMLQHRHKLTPYTGESLYGAVTQTLVRGTTVFERGEFSGPHGRLLERTR